MFLIRILSNFFNQRNYIETRAKIYEKTTGKKYNKESRKEFFLKKKKDNKNFVVTVHPSNHLKSATTNILPLSGISNSKTIYCNEGGYYSIYQSDRYGFNNPDFEWEKKKINIILLGDSFIHGACVNRPKDIGSNFRNLGLSVLNLGYGGNGPMTMYATLREYFKNETDIILWFYYKNDHNNLILEKKNLILNNYVQNKNFTQNLKFKQNIIDKKNFQLMNENIEKLNQIFHVISFLKLSELRFTLLQYFTGKNQIAPGEIIEIDDFYFKVLKDVKDFAKINKSKLYFVYIPDYSEIISEDKNLDIMKKKVKKLNIEFIDLKELLFTKEKKPQKLFLFGMPGHLTEEANKKLANSIYNYIKK